MRLPWSKFVRLRGPFTLSSLRTGTAATPPSASSSPPWSRRRTSCPPCSSWCRSSGCRCTTACARWLARSAACRRCERAKRLPKRCGGSHQRQSKYTFTTGIQRPGPTGTQNVNVFVPQGGAKPCAGASPQTRSRRRGLLPRAFLVEPGGVGEPYSGGYIWHQSAHRGSCLCVCWPPRPNGDIACSAADERMRINESGPLATPEF